MKGDGFVYLRGRTYHASYNGPTGRVRVSLRTTDADIARERLRELGDATRDAVSPRPWLRRALDRMVAGELTGQDVIRLRAPIVYAWFRGEQALYVGKGAMGLARPFSQRHHRLLTILPTDTLRIWCCDNAEDAAHRELELIRELRPTLNVKHRALATA
jgi:hypothetical protein